MQQSQSSTLRVARLPTVAGPQTGFLSGDRQTLLARPHPLLPGHVGVVDAYGTYRLVKLGEGGSRASVAAVYELELCTDVGFAQPLRKEWRDLVHLPDDGLVLCQRGSGRILFAQLPLCEEEHGPVFLFGSHDGPVLSLAANRELLLSGGADGCVRLWSLDSGAMVDCCSRAADGHAAGHVTAVAFVGPLMVAAGTEQGNVCLYDISTSHFHAVQRFHAGEGPVTALSCRLTPGQAHDAVMASAPRGLDGGGVLAGPVGLPWRSDAAGTDGRGTDTLLAVASPAGWLHVYRATRSGEDAWQLEYHRALTGAGAGEPFLSFSPDGSHLAVGSGCRLEVLAAATLRVVLEQLFPPSAPLAAAGFLPGSAGGSTLVALPLADTLAGGIRLRLFAVPAGEDPVMLQLTVPLLEPDGKGQRNAEAVRDEGLMAWLHRAATATDPTGSIGAAAVMGSSASATAASRMLSGLTLESPARHPGGSPGGAASAAELSYPAWGWQAFAPATSAHQSPAVGAQTGAQAPDGAVSKHSDRSPSAEPWASPPRGATSSGTGAARAPAAGSAGPGRRPGGARISPGSIGRSRSPLGASPGEARHGSDGRETEGDTRGPEAEPRAAGRGGEAGPAHTWQAYRPATQPAPRSWITGLPPRADFLPQPAAPPQAQQQQSATSPAHAAPRVMAPASPAPSGPAGAAARDRVAVGGSPQTAAGASPKGDREEALGVGLESEPELPCVGTLLPASGIRAAAPASSGRYPAAGAPFDDADEEGGAAASGGPWGPERHRDDRQDPREARDVPGAQGPTLQGPAATGAMHEFVAEDFAGAGGYEGVDVREYSFAKGAWAPPGGGGTAIGSGPGRLAVAEAAWRGADLDMALDGFRPSTVAAATASDEGPARGGALGTSFRFQLPQQQPQSQPHTQSLQLRWEGSEASGSEAAGRPVPSGFPNRGQDAQLNWRECSAGGDGAAFGTLYGGVEHGDTAQNDLAAGGWDGGNPEPLGRTAYLGDALAAALAPGGGHDDSTAGPRPGEPSHQSTPRSGSQRLVTAEERRQQVVAGEIQQQEHEEEEERPRQGFSVQRSRADLGQTTARGTAPPGGSDGAQRGEEEEDPEPRGAAGLPAPQPEWSQQSLTRPRFPGPGFEGVVDGEGSEVPSQLPAAARRIVAFDDDSAAWQAGVVDGVAGESEALGAEAANEAWGGWDNADILGGTSGAGGSGAALAAQRGTSRQGQGLTAWRAVPHPRQPPPGSSGRGEVSSSRAVGPAPGAAAAAADILPPSATASVLGAAADAVFVDPAADLGSSRGVSVLGGPRPALSAFRGFKPNHAKIVQQLRRKPAQPSVRAMGAEAAQPLAPPPQCAQLRPRYGADDNATPASSVSAAAGGPSTPPSLLQSPSVLLGSPNASVATDMSAPGGVRRPQKYHQHQQPQLQPQRQASGANPGAGAGAGLGSATSGGRLQLQHLRQLRHHQHQSQLLQRRGKPTHGSQPTAAAAAAADRSPLSRSTSPWETPASAQRVASGPTLQESGEDDKDGSVEVEAYVITRESAGFDGSGLEEGDGEVEGPSGAGDGDVSLQVPRLASSALLLRKMEALRQVLIRPAQSTAGARARPAPHARGKSGPGSGGDDSGPAVDGTGEVPLGPPVGLSEAAWEEAARRAATSTANVPPAATLYRDLPPLDDQAAAQPSRVAKQLHPGWVASRQVKPELGTLWRPKDHTQEVCNTRGISLYVPPSPAEVATSALDLPWLC